MILVVGLAERCAGLGDLAPALEVEGQIAAVVEGDDLGQVFEQQAEGAADRDDVDGHVELVEDEDAGIEGSDWRRGSWAGLSSRRGSGSVGTNRSVESNGANAASGSENGRRLGRRGVSPIVSPARCRRRSDPARSAYSRASRTARPTSAVRRGPSQVGGLGCARREHPGDGPADPLGGAGRLEVVEHHRHRQDRGDRVGDPLAGDVGGRAVDRLEHAGRRPRAGSGCPRRPGPCPPEAPRPGR